MLSSGCLPRSPDNSSVVKLRCIECNVLVQAILGDQSVLRNRIAGDHLHFGWRQGAIPDPYPPDCAEEKAIEIPSADAQRRGAMLGRDDSGIRLALLEDTIFVN